MEYQPLNMYRKSADYFCCICFVNSNDIQQTSLQYPQDFTTQMRNLSSNIYGERYKFGSQLTLFAIFLLFFYDGAYILENCEHFKFLQDFLVPIFLSDAVIVLNRLFSSININQPYIYILLLSLIRDFHVLFLVQSPSVVIFYRTLMGQCQVCTNEMELNGVDTAALYGQITDTEIGKDIEQLKSQNLQSLKGVKMIPLSDETCFRGKLINGKKEGYGELFCEDFNYYGFFVNNFPNGFGAILTGNHCQYGNFLNGVLNGKGKQWSQKYRFEGVYKDGQRVQGALQREQLTYTGSFINNLYEGKGTLNLKDGTNYEGMFKAGKFQGEGVLSLPNGNRYTGNFKQGKYHGYGQFIWKNGNSYKGEYFSGEREGYGVLTIGKIQYAGQWKQGVREGRGFLIQGNEQVFGDWKDNLLIQK